MVLNPSPAPRPFCVALSQSVHGHARFLYCCALYTFFFLDFVSGDLALTAFLLLTWTSDFHCFRALGVRPGARTVAKCEGLAHERDYRDCRASELKLQKCLAIVFPWIVKNTFNNGAYGEGFPTLTHWTVHKDEERKKQYIEQHQKNENWGEIRIWHSRLVVEMVSMAFTNKKAILWTY